MCLAPWKRSRKYVYLQQLWYRIIRAYSINLQARAGPSLRNSWYHKGTATGLLEEFPKLWQKANARVSGKGVRRNPSEERSFTSPSLATRCSPPELRWRKHESWAEQTQVAVGVRSSLFKELINRQTGDWCCLQETALLSVRQAILKDVFEVTPAPPPAHLHTRGRASAEFPQLC